MGNLAFKAVQKRGKDKLASDHKSLFDIPAVDIDGNSIARLGDILQGKKCVLVVNVASKWGLTDKNYTQLVKLHKEYREHGLEILAFPCNQFLGQEPGTNAEVKAFARDLYGAEFPMFAKIDVNGKDTCPVYQFLRGNSELYDTKKKEAREIPWNFAKFIVDREGKVVSYHNPKVEPNDLIKEIEEQTCKWAGLLSMRLMRWRLPACIKIDDAAVRTAFTPIYSDTTLSRVEDLYSRPKHRVTLPEPLKPVKLNSQKRLAGR